MPTPDLTIRARRIVRPDGEHPGAVVVRGPDRRVLDEAESAAGGPVADLLRRPGRLRADARPGGPHVHVNEPGRTEWEGFASATRRPRPAA